MVHSPELTGRPVALAQGETSAHAHTCPTCREGRLRVTVGTFQRNPGALVPGWARCVCRLSKTG